MKQTSDPAPSSSVIKAGLLILLTAVFFSGACRKPAASFDKAGHKKEIEKWQSDLKLGTLIINIVKRGERIGVRVKDTESQTRREFRGLEYYPIDPKWRIEARFERYQPAKTIPITNVLSMTDNETSPGALAFE